MLAFILKRLLAALPVMAVVAVVVFAILRLTPGDAAAILAGDAATHEQLAAIRHNLGLEQPIHVQFFIWISNVLHGDLGTSLLSGTPVTTMIAQRMEPSIVLCLSTIIVAIAMAVPLGVMAAWRQGKLLDRSVMALSVLGFSVPVFVTGYVLILAFSLGTGWFPVQGYKPLAERGVLLRHALRNAAVPIVTIIGVGIAMLIGGVVVTESVFNIPGLGRLVVEAVLARDYPVIQGLILLFALVYVLINLAVDVSYTVLDPRIRY